MSDTEETLKQEPTLTDVMGVLAAINKRLEGVEKRFDDYDAQFEAIRQGISDNAVRFDRLEGNFLLLRADVRELKEEIKHNRKVLV